MHATNLFKLILPTISIISLAAVLASCGGGGDNDNNDGSDGGSTLYKIGGEISGLTGSVILQNNGADDLTVNANGSFTFATSLADSNAYLVTVSVPPSEQACSVSNGRGAVSAATVSNVSVTCIAISAPPAAAAMPTLDFDIKTFRFAWTDVADATSYRLLENADGSSGFSQVGTDIAPGAQDFNHSVALYQRSAAEYILQSCNSFGCTDGATISITGTLADAVGYFKASNTGGGDEFGIDVALSADGNTLAVGARDEEGSTGAVYIYSKTSSGWASQAFVKADNASSGDLFGSAISLSADGTVLAVGAPTKAPSGTVYLFKRSGTNWSQQDFVNAASPGGTDFFGDALSLSDDGVTLAVAARAEASESTGLGSNGADGSLNGAANAGAAYIYTENAGVWTQQEYFKADNAEGGDFFGSSIALSADGNTFVVGATGEDNTAATSLVVPTDTDTGDNIGAAYVYSRNGSTWGLQSYIKASNQDNGDNFGGSVSLSDDGNTLAVGAVGEDSSASGIAATSDELAEGAGAVYVFTRNGTSWSEQEFIKASNTDAGDNFGHSISLSANGNTLAVTALREQGNAIGINGDETNNSLNGTNGAGAAYVFSRNAGFWAQQAYVKASNPANGDFYGSAIELSGDGNTLAVGASLEDSNATGVSGDASNNDSPGAGAVYLY